MENNKYYVPEIEEFRVGFEYETTLYKDIWEPVVYDGEFPLSSGLIPDPNVCRVKYLSTQDIEELGFEKATTQIHFRKDDIEIVLWDIKNVHIRRVIDSTLTVNGIKRILVEPLY